MEKNVTIDVYRKKPSEIVFSKFTKQINLLNIKDFETCIYNDAYNDSYFNDVYTCDFPIHKVAGLVSEYFKLIAYHFLLDANIHLVADCKLNMGKVLALSRMILLIKGVDFGQFVARVKSSYPKTNFCYIDAMLKSPEVEDYFPLLIHHYVESRLIEAKDTLGSCREYVYDKIHQNIKKNVEDFMEVDTMNYEDAPVGIDVSKYKREITLRSYTPSMIMNKLKERVYGQDEALQQISLMAYSHIKRACNPQKCLKKQNYMLLGPTGSGKTEIARALDEALPLPVVTLNVASAVPSGWKGASVAEMLINQLKPYAEHEFADYAIVIFDEFDKLIKKSQLADHDIYGEEIQGDLLKMIEGGMVFNDGYQQSADDGAVNTENMLFICAGAFEGLLDNDNVVVGEAKVSFTNNCHQDFNDTEIREKLLEYGVLRELLGRIGNFTFINTLTAEDYVYIMTNLKGSMLASIKNECSLAEAEFKYSEKALLEAANCAMKQQLGVRGMEHIIKKAISKNLFDAANGKAKTVSLTLNSVKEAIS